MASETASPKLWRDSHAEPKTQEEIERFILRWKDDPEGFAHRWGLNRFLNANIARDLSPDERAQRDREKAILGEMAAIKPKKGRKKKVVGDEIDLN
jgi:hypothetical protein